MTTEKVPVTGATSTKSYQRIALSNIASRNTMMGKWGSAKWYASCPREWSGYVRVCDGEISNRDVCVCVCDMLRTNRLRWLGHLCRMTPPQGVLIPSRWQSCLRRWFLQLTSTHDPRPPSSINLTPGSLTQPIDRMWKRKPLSLRSNQSTPLRQSNRLQRNLDWFWINPDPDK
jgi:hypothetical protein